MIVSSPAYLSKSPSDSNLCLCLQFTVLVSDSRVAARRHHRLKFVCSFNKRGREGRIHRKHRYVSSYCALTFVGPLIVTSFRSDYPIFALVQAHTNLTEIKTSLGLFSRAGVPFDRIVLGLGFYVNSISQCRGT